MQADTTSFKGVVIPNAFKEPSWVQETYDRFINKIKEDYRQSNSLNTALVRKLFKDVLLDGRISVSFPLNKKNVTKLMQDMYKKFDSEEFQWRYYLVYRVGFTLSTFTSISFTPESLELPGKFKPMKKKIIDDYHIKLEEAKSEADRERANIWVDKAFKKLTTEVLAYFREHRDKYPVIDLLDSGAKGSDDDFRKLLVAIGLSINARGEINDVIDRSGAEGLSPTQFFNYTSQAIVSQYRKSSETAIPGYLIRQLNTMASGVVLSKLIDCKSNQYLKVRVLDKNMLVALEGKIMKGGKEIKSDDTDLISKDVEIRSALYCKEQDGICHVCYNPGFIDRMKLMDNAGIGLLASSSLAVTLTNMTLKAAHTGLSLDRAEVDLTQDVFTYNE